MRKLIYSLPMRFLLSILIFLLPFLCGADVYRWIGSDGQTYYSDRAVAGAEPVGIQLDKGKESVEKSGSTEKTGADAARYNAFEIVDPEPNQTVSDGAGKVGISLLIEPPLSANHRLEILVNGQPVPGAAQGTQIELQGLRFGSHAVQARIRDDLDAIVASSPVVNFHLRKPLPEDLQP